MAAEYRVIERRVLGLAIGLILIVAVVLTLPPDAGDILFRWQTLASGVLAVFAGGFALLGANWQVSAIRGQIQEQNKAEKRRRVERLSSALGSMREARNAIQEVEEEKKFSLPTFALPLIRLRELGNLISAIDINSFPDERLVVPALNFRYFFAVIVQRLEQASQIQQQNGPAVHVRQMADIGLPHSGLEGAFNKFERVVSEISE